MGGATFPHAIARPNTGRPPAYRVIRAECRRCAYGAGDYRITRGDQKERDWSAPRTGCGGKKISRCFPNRRSCPRWPAPLVEPGAVFAHLLALRCRRVTLAGRGLV